MQQFLSFWNTYNVTIIEVLIAIIVLTVGVLVYTLFFGKKEDAAIDSAGIEKTLQKILEAQGHKVAEGAASPVAATEVAGAATTNPAMAEELAQLRASLQEKEAQIEQLKTANPTGDASADPAKAGGAATVAAAVDTSALEARIKELEANLAEYEIISEDIADLSRYKEENARLLKQIESSGAAAKTATTAVPAPEPAAPADAPAAAPAPAAPVAEEAPVVSEAAPVAPTEVAAATDAPAAEATVPSEPAASVVDDELMKEFAAAVEGQKTSTVNNETDKLMNDFENFMKKG